MNTPPEKSPIWVTDKKVDKPILKQFAIKLEQKLSETIPQSREIAEFAKYEPLISAIKRAKAMEIELPEELPGMRYWLFETDVGNYLQFKEFGDCLSKFELALKCWRREE
jgi:hypothetical protein